MLCSASCAGRLTCCLGLGETDIPVSFREDAFFTRRKPREGSCLSLTFAQAKCHKSGRQTFIWKSNANDTCTVNFVVKRIDAGNFWWLYIYIYMYMYRGSSYIKWPFILECCCLLCSLSPTASHVGVLLQSASRRLSYPSKNLTIYLNSASCPLSPTGAGLRLLQRSCGAAQGNPAVTRRAGAISGTRLVHGVF